MEKAVEMVLNKMGVAVATVIPLYAKWYFVNALVWILASIPCFVVAFFLWEKSKEEDSNNYLIIISIIAAFIGVYFILSNITNLITPEPYAIHQLLKDIRR